MAKNVGNIAHKKSAQVLKDAGGSVLGPKLPDASMLVEGEIAVNYADGYETLSIKNSSGEISTFSSDAIISDTIDSKISGKADTTAVTAVNKALTAHTANTDVHVTTGDKATWNTVTAKANTSDLTAHTGDTTAHITANERTKWNAKAEASAVTTVNNALTAHTADTTAHVTDNERTKWNAVTGKADTSAVTTVNKALTAHTASTDVHVTTADKTKWNAVTGKADSSTVSAINSTLTSHTGNTTIHVTSDDKTKWNTVTGKADTSAVTTVSDNLSAHTANTTVHVTQANKDTWNKVTSKADASAVTTVSDSLSAHTANTTVHITAAERTKWNNKAEASAVTTVNNALTTHTTNNDIHVTAEKKDAWDAKAEVSDVTAVSDNLVAHTADTTAHITANERTMWNTVTGKANTNDVYSKTAADAKFQALGNYVSATTLDNYSTTAQVEEKIKAAVTGKADSSTVTSINDVLTAHTNNADIHVTTADKATWNAVTSKADSSTVTSINNILTAHTASTSVHVTTDDKTKWNAVTSKADSSTVTSINNTLTAHTGNGNIHVTTDDKAKWNEVTGKTNTSDFNNHTDNTTVHITADERTKWNNKAEVSNIPTKVSQLKNDSSFIRSAQYDSTAKAIKFYDIASSAITTATTAVATVDATAFIKDGMVSSASVSNGKLVITFNADAGKENISIPITDIFNANNYYTKANTYSKTEVNSLLNDKSSTSHTHAISGVTGLQAALDGKANTTHTHAISGVTGLQSALDGKSNTGHVHEISGVTGLQAALDGKSNTNHTHKYAGSSSAGGAANSAVKLDTATAGSTTQPVYFTGGKPAACSYTLGASVPSNAVFTDTHYASTTVTSNASGGTSTVAATGNGTVYLNHVENNSVTSSHNIKGSGATTVTSDSAGTITISSTKYGVATQSANGLMSSDDKKKLDGVASGANNYTHPSATAYANGLYKVTVNNLGHVTSATTVSKSDITALGIPAQDTTYSTATQSANGLMSSGDKKKLDGITESADSVSFSRSLTSGTKVGTITINGTGTDLYCQTNTDTHYSSTTVTSNETGGTSNVAATGNGTVYLNHIENGNVKSSHKIIGAGATTVTSDSAGTITITSTDTNTTYGVATQSANGLMSSGDKKKLDGIASGANNYTHPTATAYNHGLYKVTVNNLGHVTSATTVAKSDITALGIPAQDTHYSSNTIVASANTATANGAASNGNVYLNHIENGKVRNYHNIKGGGATTVTSDSAGTITITSTDNNTTYSAGSGISFNGTQINNSGVRSIGTGSDNGTISVNTNGSTANVAVKGLGTAAYTESGAYLASGGTAVNASKVANTLTLQLNGGSNISYNGSAAQTFNVTPSGIGAAAANHTHKYAGSSSAGGAATSANKVANALTLQFNGTTNQTYDGSAAKTFNVTPSAIGAAASSHTHNYAGSSSAGGVATSAYAVASRGALSAYTSGSTEMGAAGINLYNVYNNGYPTAYGNLIHVRGQGAGQLLAGWSGSAALGHLYYRSKRDNSDSGWSNWGTVAFTSDTVAAANKLATARTIALSGSVTGSATFDGSGNITIGTTTNHTHNYAGSNSAGGAANSAVALTTATAGSATQPVYFTGGKPAACTYTLGKSVPADAVFTDTNTHYASNTIVASAATATSNGAAENGNVYLNHIENGGVRNAHKIVGGGATTVTSDTAGTITISSTNTTYGTATTSANGLMSAGDKSKLDGIQAGADAVSFTRSLTGGTKIGTLTINGTGTDLYCQTNTNTTYSAGAGIGLNGTQFYNTGVRSIATGSANGTISVNTNGTDADVAVKGLGSAAYTNSNAYAAASHTHKYAGSSSAGGAANSSNVLNSNARMDYGWNGINYFNADLAAGCKAKTNDAPTKAWWHIMRFNHSNNEGYYTDLAIPFNSDSLYWKTVRGGSLPHASWVQVLDAINYTSYAPTKKGGGASGTWDISVTGNAATASKLATARTITLAGSVTGSVSFDGSGNVTANTTTNHTHNYAGSSSAGGAATSANKVANALTLQLNGTTNQTYDGSAARTFNVTPAAIGAAASSHSHNYAGSSSAGGAANSVANALTLQFNGTTNQTYDGSAAKTFNVTPSAIGALPTAAQQFKAVDVTTNQSNVTNPFTFTADGQNGTVMYRNTGSANVTISISTNHLSPTNEQIFFTIVPGGYGEVNYLRYNSSVIVARGL